MATNGHASLVKQDSTSTAIVEVNSLSEDNQLVNPADHYGKYCCPLTISLLLFTQV
jgi:hypothetical protein